MKKIDLSRDQFFGRVKVSRGRKKKFEKKNHFSGFAHQNSKMAAIFVKICDKEYTNNYKTKSYSCIGLKFLQCVARIYS